MKMWTSGAILFKRCDTLKTWDDDRAGVMLGR